MQEKRHLYVTCKSPALWLSALCAAGAVAGSFLAPAAGSAAAAGAAVVYVLALLLWGQEQLYRTRFPVWLLGLVQLWLGWHTRSGELAWLLLSWGCTIVGCAAYGRLIGGQGRPWLLLPALVLGWAGGFLSRCGLSVHLAWLAPAVLIPGVKTHTDGKYHPFPGDRIEGRLIRSAPAMELILPYFMPDRNGADNFYEDAVEITELEQYIRRKRREGLTGFGSTHVIMAAYARTVARYPALNRFVAGQKIYSRGEDIAMCMTVKKEMTRSAPDSLIKVHAHPTDTAEEVYRKFQAKVEEAKDEMETTNADNTADAFMRIPGLVLSAAVWLLKVLDYFGLVPKFLLEVSPFHGSAYFTAIGSLGIRPVYHHLYDFGTVPLFCAFGRKRRAQELHDGQVVERKYIDLRFSLDERICDGYYYSCVIKYFMRLLTHPDVLDNPPETVETDIP